MTEPPACTATALLNAAPDAVITVNGSGEITYANDRIRDLFGYEPEDIVGERVERLVPEDIRETHVKQRDAFLANPSRRPMGVGLELRGRHADGSTIPVDVSLSPICDETHVMAVIRDATERREHHRQVTRLRTATRRLMEAETTEAVADLVATAATNLFGYESSVFRIVEGGHLLRPVALAESEGIDLGERPDYPIDEETPVTRVYKRGEPEYHDDVREFDDGYDRGDARGAMYVPIGEYGVLSVLDRAVDAFDRPDLELASSLAANAETILDRLHHEHELERQIERLDEFSGVVSHDLLNPLNVAQGHLELIRDENRHGQESLDAIDDALERMETIVESTLTLARHGNVVGETEPLAIDSLAKCCWNRIDAPNAQLQLDNRVRVYGDSDRLEHVFENLFSNAVTHGRRDDAEDDTSTLTVQVGRLDEAVGFYVEDDGCGIPASKQDCVFETGYTDSTDGTGFGLAIVRQIASAHGWQTRVTDGRDGGARFEFTDVEFA